jgi:hypothetical protein
VQVQFLEALLKFAEVHTLCIFSEVQRNFIEVLHPDSDFTEKVEIFCRPIHSPLGRDGNRDPIPDSPWEIPLLGDRDGEDFIPTGM